MNWVVITGPESTGKSTLTHQLAESFDGVAISEYARDYVERLNKPYNKQDVETIGKRQLLCANRLCRTYEGSDVLIFFDTFLIVTKVWLEEVYNYCPVCLNLAILNNLPNLVLLCEPDLPWKQDGVRENKEKRGYLYNRYKKELEYYQIPYSIVNGSGDARLQLAIQHIKKLYKHTL